jgi:hypothetical protein
MSLGTAPARSEYSFMRAPAEAVEAAATWIATTATASTAAAFRTGSFMDISSVWGLRAPSS